MARCDDAGASDQADGSRRAAEQADERLSEQLERWFGQGVDRTIGELVDGFGPRSFAVSFVVLMAFPALPLPTGGLSHLLEVAAMLLALELVAGRSEVWVPARWREKPLRGLSGGAGRALVRRVQWFERYSRPRLGGVLELGAFRRLFGLLVFALALAAFLAPPFSGLDTLPALGVVVLGIGVLLHDIVIAAAGLALGAAGVAVIVGLGHAIVQLL